MTPPDPVDETPRKNRRRSAQDFERSEPVFSSTAPRSSEARSPDQMGLRPDGNAERKWPGGRPASFLRPTPRRRPRTLWIAASVFVAAAGFVTYLYLPPSLPGPTTETETAVPPSQTAELPPPPPATSMPTEKEPDATASTQAAATPTPPPPQTANLPATPTGSQAAGGDVAALPQANPAMLPPLTPQAANGPATPSVNSPPAGNDVAALPFANPPVQAPLLKPPPQPSAAAQPEPARTFSPQQPTVKPPDTTTVATQADTPSTTITRGSAASHEHPVREARAKPRLSIAPDEANTPDLAPAEPQAEDDTVTIDGTT
jgi:hypothetical protein